MTDAFMNRIDNGLPIRADFVDILIQVNYPVECLGGRRDVVALRAEYHDRRPDISEVQGGTLRCLDLACRKIISDKQLIDNELNLLSIKVHVAAPPALEAEVARGFRVDL